MSRKANPTIIGAFVVGAVVIAVAAVLVLTSGQLFREKLSMVMHFDGSVKGLSVGAPVSYRGVQIGTVTNIAIVLEPEQDARIPVTVQIDPSAFTIVDLPSSNIPLAEFRKGIYDSCKNEGLRAQLQMQSLLTGQLFIQLDYFPDSEARFVEAGNIAEIPTVQTTLQELGSVLQDFPVKDTLAKLDKAVTSLAELTSDERIGQSIESINQAFKDVSQLVTNLDSRTQALQPALVESRQVLVEGRQALAQATSTLVAAEQTFKQATKTLAPMKNLVADDSELLESLDNALRAMTDAAQAVGTLAETLERRPESLLRGKGVFGGE